MEIKTPYPKSSVNSKLSLIIALWVIDKIVMIILFVIFGR